jgi:hypothetical protein
MHTGWERVKLYGKIKLVTPKKGSKTIVAGARKIYGKENLSF